MTIKELVQFTGKTERTLRRWIKKAEINELVTYDKMSQGVEIEYNINQVEAILRSSSLSKDAVNILMQNARGNNLPVNQIDYEAIGKMIAIAVSSAMQPLVDEIKEIKNQTVKSLPAPQMGDRERFNKLIRDYAEKKLHGDYQQAYRDLYRELLYRLKINVKVRSKNAGVKKIDWLDAEGYLPQCIAIIIEMGAE